jgi:hypothetical protein
MFTFFGAAHPARHPWLWLISLISNAAPLL